jgi:prepilin-type N-terminal cleavage/methylation domain-containing protein
VICRRGLTLIELLVALTITGLVMGFGYAALSFMVDHRTRVMASSEEIISAAAKRRMLVSWLRGARVPIEGDTTFQGVQGIDADRPDDALTFVTVAPTPLGSHETVVRVYVDRDHTTPEHGLSVMLTDRNGATVRRMEVEPHVTGLDIRYLSGIAGTTSWRESWSSTPSLPTAVRLTVSSEDPDGLPSLLRPPIVVGLWRVE